MLQAGMATKPERIDLKAAQKWRHRPRRALPFVLMDADALRQLFETHPNPGQGLDLLSQPGRSTLIIPRTVMNEILRYEHTSADGSLTLGAYDFYTREDGSLDFYTGQNGLLDDARRSFSHYLESAREQGKLRCYESLDAMRRSGEMTRPKGGIVIVDTIAPERAAPPSRKGVKFIATILPGETSDRAIHFSSVRKQAGDKALATLAAYLCRHAPEQQHKGSLLVISNDTVCKQNITARCRDYTHHGIHTPSQASLSQLLHTLEYSGQMSVEDNQQAVQTMMKDRIQALQKRGDNPATHAEKAARISYGPSSASYMNACLDWLEATRITPRQSRTHTR